MILKIYFCSEILRNRKRLGDFDIWVIREAKVSGNFIRSISNYSSLFCSGQIYILHQNHGKYQMKLSAGLSAEFLNIEVFLGKDSEVQSLAPIIHVYGAVGSYELPRLVRRSINNDDLCSSSIHHSGTYQWSVHCFLNSIFRLLFYLFAYICYFLRPLF